MSAPPKAGARRHWATGAAGTAVLLASLDAYVVVTILTGIITDLGIPINELQRATPIITGYLLAYIAAMPLLGQLSDRLGRTRVLQGSLAAFAVGSVASALARSLPVLVAARVFQGAAAGALLPVTFAVVGDLWEEHDRQVPLGLVGSVQELGSVLGPLYGALLAAAIGWRGLFWVNLPLAAVAIVIVGRTKPGRGATPGRKVDVVGGLLLAAGLTLVIVGLYNPDPAQGVLPAWGVWAVVGGVLALACFVAWERQAPVRLLTPGPGRVAPFSAALGTSFLSGAALMVTLVDVPLLAETILGKDSLGAALLLLRFLVALALGAALGGFFARHSGDRQVAVVGLLVAAAGYLLMARWGVDVLGPHYGLGFISLPRADVDLVISGLGLGVVVAPLASVVLRASTAGDHGAASAGVVAARMTGMLVGIGALAAWGLHRFNSLTANLAPPAISNTQTAATLAQLAAYESALKSALHIEYSEIFLITAAICVAGALCAVALGRSPGRVGATLTQPVGQHRSL
ncbi:MAG TPA: MFS transporter [Actinomycetota bacterium]|nr:MFS transporter [Actinomycetota bacterium]